MVVLVALLGEPKSTEYNQGDCQDSLGKGRERGRILDFKSGFGAKGGGGVVLESRVQAVRVLMFPSM